MNDKRSGFGKRTFINDAMGKRTYRKATTIPTNTTADERTISRSYSLAVVTRKNDLVHEEKEEEEEEEKEE
ncbi:hypothetical protein RB195_008969 [Necator americanus]|uniref:Uncharacterized protein n=1 Tax=Necator americanus TaxID=51031 RepID=A0ABR1CSL4_NECAM